jgi:RNA polymerase sigma factor (sigma-70 family)
MAAISSDRSRPAFSELFDFYAPRIKSYMLRLGASDGEAEELAQDVMITVWQKAGMYDRKQASVSTWMFRIARNRRIDLQRRQRGVVGDEQQALAGLGVLDGDAAAGAADPALGVEETAELADEFAGFLIGGHFYFLLFCEKRGGKTLRKKLI